MVEGILPLPVSHLPRGIRGLSRFQRAPRTVPRHEIGRDESGARARPPRGPEGAHRMRDLPVANPARREQDAAPLPEVPPARQVEGLFRRLRRP